MKMTDAAIFILFFIVFSGIAYLGYFHFVKKKTTGDISKSSTITATIKGTPFALEVADTSELRAKGLMNRESLPENGGMLFVFDRVGIYPFWMKNTKIPLDMLWLDADKKVVYIKENAQPCDTTVGALCNSIVPTKLAKYVVELNGGSASQLDIQIGEMFSWN